MMSRLAGCLVVAFALPAATPAQELPIVERVEITGNQYIRSETLFFYVSTKAGERYGERRIKEDFRRLWSTALLDDLKLEVSDGPTGKIVVFRVTERKRVRAIEYRGGKVLSGSHIEEALRKRNLALRLDALYDDARGQQVERAILDMLVAKGRPFGTVRREVKDVSGPDVRVSFLIDDGPRTVVEDIAFDGNTAFSDGELRGRMKLKRAGLVNLSWLRGRGAYAPEKWSGSDQDAGDRARLLQFYLDHGYVTVRIGEPKIATADDNAADGEATRRVWLRIPVVEGEQYRVGDVKLEGLSVFTEDEVRPLFALKKGAVYDDSKIQRGNAKLRELYGRKGYFQASATTRRAPDAEKKLVNLVLAVEEDKRYFVGKIRIAGNETTRDKVIRREVLLNEGEVFDTDALAQSIRRVNQLGYFKPMERAPELTVSPKASDSLDVTFRVREENPTRFSLGGGLSGVEGAFLNGSFATANLLGLGETLQLTAQSGTLTRNYQFGITKPYLMDRPITAGFDVFHRRQTYKTESSQGVQGYLDERTGGSLLAGFSFAKWSRLFLTYSYEVIDISLRDITGLPPASVASAVFLGDVGRRRESTLRPTLVRNTLDQPLMPRRGTRLSVSLPVTGGPLRGTLDFVKPRLEVVAYLPQGSRAVLGVRAEVGGILPFGDTARRDATTGRNQLPFYERFFLGGETQIRGYDIRSVGPRDASNQAIGGNKYLLLNAEYSWEPVHPLRLMLFYDAGQAFADGKGFSLSGLQKSTGVELRVLMPLLNVPLRLIYAWNLNREPFQPVRAFKFAIGTTF